MNNKLLKVLFICDFKNRITFLSTKLELFFFFFIKILFKISKILWYFNLKGMVHLYCYLKNKMIKLFNVSFFY